MNAIDKLEQTLWSRCVTEHAAEDDATVKRWQEDELAHLRMRFHVTPMDEALRPLVEDAVREWERREGIFLSRAMVTDEQFLSEFDNFRKLYFEGKLDAHDSSFELADIAHGAVKNMGWVNLFAWVLPKADSSHVETHRKRGKIVTAIYYTEMLGKYGLSDDPGAKDILARVEARWQIIQE